jgi:hypothetical protein
MQLVTTQPRAQFPPGAGYDRPMRRFRLLRGLGPLVRTLPSALWLAAAAAFALRALASLVLGGLDHPEIFEQEQIVHNLLAGRGLTYWFLGTTYRSFHSNLVTDGVVAAVYLATGSSHAALLAVQWAGASALTLVVGRLGARLGPEVAVVAAWLCAAHPPLVVYDATKLQQVSLDALLVAALTLALVRLREASTLSRALVVGALGAAAVYERPTLALFLVVGLAWARAPLRRSTAALALAAALVAPWTVRNTRVHGRLVLLSTQSGLALWKGNHAGATGTEFDRDGRPLLEVLPDELRHRVLDAPTELGQMEAFRDAAVAFLRSSPGAAARLYATKLGLFWWRGGAIGASYPPWWPPLYQTLWGALVLAGAFGVWRARGRAGWPLVGLVLLLGATFSMGQALLYVAGRHRFTIEPVLLVLSALGLVEGHAALRRQARG